MKDLVIIGGGNSGKDIIHIVEAINNKNPEWNLLGVIDEKIEFHNQPYLNTKYLGGIDWIKNYQKELFVVCGIGNIAARKRLLDLAAENTFVRFPNLIHPSAEISKHSTLGKGNIVSAFCQIQPSAIIGNFNFLNLGVHIGHDCKVGDYCALNPKVGMYNLSQIGNMCYLAARSTIIQKAKLEDGVFVAAGTIVNKDVPEGNTVMGYPCKIFKQNFYSLTR